MSRTPVRPAKPPQKPASKTCAGACAQPKPLAAFGKHAREPDGLRKVCKACTAAAERARDRARSMPPADRLEGLKPYGTPMQRATIEALLTHGSIPAAGYRAGQDMRLHVWHRRWGKINEHHVGIQQVRFNVEKGEAQ